jgi:hypothetical protein
MIIVNDNVPNNPNSFLQLLTLVLIENLFGGNGCIGLGTRTLPSVQFSYTFVFVSLFVWGNMVFLIIIICCCFFRKVYNGLSSNDR